MILMITMGFSMIGLAVAILVQLCLIRRTIKQAGERQVAAIGSLSSHMGKLMRYILQDKSERTGTDLADDIAKIMAYTGGKHGD